MGVAERKEKHKEDLKKDILIAAKELFTEKGFEATSIRAIAEKIEYSPATIYLYFKDKNEIVHALHRDGFQLLVKYLETLNVVSHPLERLKGMGRAYIQFAMQNPDIYQLLFIMKEPLKHVANCYEEWDEGDRAFDILLRTVEDCQKEGYLVGPNKEMLAFMIWSTMHGMCSLRTSGHLQHVVNGRDKDANVEHVVAGCFETFAHVLENMKG